MQSNVTPLLLTASFNITLHWPDGLKLSFRINMCNSLYHLYVLPFVLDL